MRLQICNIDILKLCKIYIVHNIEIYVIDKDLFIRNELIYHNINIHI